MEVHTPHTFFHLYLAGNVLVHTPQREAMHTTLQTNVVGTSCTYSCGQPPWALPLSALYSACHTYLELCQLYSYSLSMTHSHHKRLPQLLLKYGRHSAHTHMHCLFPLCFAYRVGLELCTVLACAGSLVGADSHEFQGT